jgi:PKD repeat protein
MLYFVSMSDYQSIYTDLIVADTIYISGTDTTIEAIDDDPALRIFEDNLNFYSLRQQVQADENYALDNNLWPTSDPDEHFIQSEYLRSILNPDLEVKIGSSIYKILSNCTIIEIKNSNWTLLTSIRSHIGSSSLLADLADTGVNIFSYRGDCGLLVADYTRTKFSGSINFTNNSTSNAKAFYWKFGQINSSTIPNPTYSGTFPVNVTMVVSDSSGNFYKFYKTEAAASSCSAFFRFAISDKTVNLIDLSMASSGGTLSTWLWDFGDGATSTTQSPAHIYTNYGTYTIKLTITDNQGCSEVFKKVINITEPQTSPTCCSADKEVIRRDEYNSSNNAIKCKLYCGNIGVLAYHEIGVKTKHFTKKSNGNWKKSKADEILAGLEGEIYDEDCNTHAHANNQNRRMNSRKAKWTFSAFNGRIHVSDHSIGAIHYSKINNSTITENQFICN